MRKFISFGLVLIMALSVLSGCKAKDDTPVVMKLGDCVVTEAMYRYWLSNFKGQYISAYEDVNNTEEYWSSELYDGKTVSEYFEDLTLSNIKSYLAAMKLFDDYKLSISSSQKKSIDNYINDLIKEYADGNKSNLNMMLSEYGINLDLLRDIYLEETKTTVVYNYLYGDNGVEKLSDKEYEDYYQDNYVHFQMIYINNMYEYSVDENGNYITDDDGYYITESMNTELKAEKDKKIEEILNSLEDGEDFDYVYNKYSELKEYSNGYYFSLYGSYSDVIYYDLVNKCNELKVGEYGMVSGETGTCIILKLENDSNAWSSKSNSDFFEDFKSDVCESVYSKKLTSMFDEIEIDEVAISRYSIATITPSYTF